MKIRMWIALTMILVAAAGLPARALDPEDFLEPADPAKLEQFRADLVLLAQILDQHVGGQLQPPSLTERIQGLSEDELLAFFNVMPRDGLAAAVDAMARVIGLGHSQRYGLGPNPKVIVGTNDAEFPPDYPSGPDYDVFTATLAGLGAISDTNGDGNLNDEGCDSNYEAGLQIGLAVAAVANSTAQGACAIAGADPTGVATGVACSISAATDLVQVAIEIAIAQCDFQGGAVSGAEIEAGYENSRIIVQALTCQTTAGLRKGHGCDGEDDNCDLVADECAEDTFGPDVDVTGNVSAGWFASATQAAAVVAAATSAIDDCQSVTVQAPVISGTCDGAAATVTATDSCGNQSSASAPVRIDGESPVISIAGSIPGSCHTSVEAAELATLGATSASDNCATFGPGDVEIHSAVTDCSLRIRTTVTDDAGLTASTAATVRVDTAQPTVEIERLLLGTQLPFCYASAADAEATVFGASRFTDNCTATEDLAKSVSSSGDLCNLLVTSQAVDECGIANTDSVTVRVDVTAPTVSCTVGVDELGTNHEMVDVGFSHAGSDNCELSSLSVRVTSDESTTAPGSGNQSHSPDAELLRDGGGLVTGVRLRAERVGSGDGRVYAIHVTGIDRCGNSETAVCTVGVPPNGNGTAVDSGQLYDATAVN